MQHFIHAFKLYGVFSGRSTREEYWMFTLIYLVVYVALSAVAFAFESEMFNAILGILSLGVVVPSLSITSRRLHDMGRSGWWQASPYIGAIFSFIGIAQTSTILMTSGLILMVVLFVILLVFLVKASEEDNVYGIQPKP
ncbi:MAG: DUF805 domain-containing protein [Ghiorsea sp.]